MNKIVGRRIREFREIKGILQEEMAERLKVSRSTYQRIENGDTNSWVNYMDKISEVLGINKGELLKGEDNHVQLNHANNNQTDANDNITIENVGQNQTMHYNLSNKLIEQYEIRISEYKEEILEYKEEIKLLKEKLAKFE